MTHIVIIFREQCSTLFCLQWNSITIDILSEMMSVTFLFIVSVEERVVELNPFNILND